MVKACWPVVMALSLVACTDTEEAPLELAKLWPSGPQPSVRFPASAAVGEPFEVRIGTEGHGCLQFGSTTIEERATGRLITPWNRPATGDGACSLGLVLVEHTAMLQFDQPGPAAFGVRALDGSTVVELSFDVEVTAP